MEMAPGERESGEIENAPSSPLESSGGKLSPLSDVKVDEGAAEVLRRAEVDQASGLPMRIIILRVLVFICFILLAALLGYFVYTVTYNSQLRELESTYDSAAAQLTKGIQINMDSKTTAASSTGSFFHFGLSNSNLSYAYFAEFEPFGARQAALTSVRAVGYAALITPPTRPDFETYTRENYQLVPGLTDNITIQSIKEGIYFKRNGANAVYAKNASNEIFFPIVQIAPMATNQFALSFDLYSEPNRRVAIDLAMKTGQPACTDIIQLVQDTAVGAARASGLVINMVYTAASIGSNESHILGLSSSVFSWDGVIKASLPSTAPVWILLTSSGDRQFSFTWDGSKVVNLGNGDLVTANIPDNLLAYKRTASTTIGLTFTMTMYPAQSLWDHYMTTLPRDLCIAVVAGIVAVVIVFMAYDYLASGRSRALDSIARAANRVLEDVRLVAKAHDFAEELQEMNQMNQTAGLADHVATKPRELERHLVTTLEIIGSGAFGKVHKGLFHEKTMQGSPSYLVAIKVFEKPSELEMRQIFMEALVMNQIKHRHILSLIGVVTKDRPVYLLTEYCEHGSLEKVLREHKGLFNASRLLMAHDVASAMVALHSMRLVHRDLAARNVLVDSSFRCKVSDFGHARRVSSSEYYESTTGRIAIRWVAPEALAEKKFSEMSDVWSFGVLLWEIWSCGEVPYGDWSNNKVWLEVGNGYRLKEPLGCPTNLYTIMRQCWAETSRNRPTFSDLLGNFVRMLNGDTDALQRDFTESKRVKSGDTPGTTLTMSMSSDSSGTNATNSGDGPRASFGYLREDDLKAAAASGDRQTSKRESEAIGHAGNNASLSTGSTSAADYLAEDDLESGPATSHEGQQGALANGQPAHTASQNFVAVSSVADYLIEDEVSGLWQAAAAGLDAGAAPAANGAKQESALSHESVV